MQSIVTADNTVVHWLKDGVYILGSDGVPKFFPNKKLTPDGMPNMDTLINAQQARLAAIPPVVSALAPPPPVAR